MLAAGCVQREGSVTLRGVVKVLLKGGRVGGREFLMGQKAAEVVAPLGVERVPFEPGVSRLGIDVGGVISLADTDSGGGGLGEKVARYVVSDECVTAVRRLVGLFGGENVFILSKCGVEMQRTTVAMLERNRFFERVGMERRNALFCLKRSGGEFKGWERVRAGGEERAAVGECGKGAVAKEVGLTHMIDDREDCLRSVRAEAGVVGVKFEGEKGWRDVIDCFGLGAQKVRYFVFDLDRTLLMSPEKPAGWGLGWFDSKASLAEGLECRQGPALERLLGCVGRAGREGEAVKFVLCTGRVAELREEVLEMLERFGVDRSVWNGGIFLRPRKGLVTSEWKGRVVAGLVREAGEGGELHMWDDDEGVRECIGQVLQGTRGLSSWSVMDEFGGNATAGGSHAHG